MSGWRHRDGEGGLSLGQLPLGIPTVATFFEDSHFEGAPMVVLPKATDIPQIGSQHLDHNHSGGTSPFANLNDARNIIANELSAVSAVLSTLSFFASVANFPGAKQLALVADMATRIRDAGHLVIDSTGDQTDLEDAVLDTHLVWPDDDFDDAAGSMILFGVNGFGKAIGYESSNHQDKQVVFQMPPTTIVAAIWDFEYMRVPMTFMANRWRYRSSIRITARTTTSTTTWDRSSSSPPEHRR